MDNHELSISIYTPLHQNTPLITAVWCCHVQYSVQQDHCANFVLANSYFGLWDYVPPLAQSCHLHILCRIYKSLHWQNILFGQRGEHTFIKLFHFPICFIVETKHYEQKYDQVHFHEFTWKVIDKIWILIWLMAKFFFLKSWIFTWYLGQITTETDPGPFRFSKYRHYTI